MGLEKRILEKFIEYNIMKPLYSQQEFTSSSSRQLLPLQCLCCENTFLLPKNKILTALNKNRQETADFCSKKCRAVYQFPPVIIQCLQCSVNIKKYPKDVKKSQNHFCSSSCAAKYNNAHKTKGTRVSKLEKWIQSKLTSLYPNIEFHFNRKDTINGELDIYIPSLKLAFELNGIFHYEPIYGPEKLSSIQNNDTRKSQACFENHIELCIIDTSSLVFFKENKALKFLNIIETIITNKTNGGG